jgi:hypothetical protein
MSAKILAERASATLASAWNEYLTIRNIGPGRARLEICQYEVLAEWFAREDEDGNEILVPSIYKGKKVVGVEDGYLVGGDLIPSDSDWCEVDTTDIDEAIDWIKSEKFKVGHDIKASLLKFL